MFNLTDIVLRSVIEIDHSVSNAHQGQGVGSQLISLILGIVSSAPFAVRLLTVDAVNDPQVINFYRQVGFIESLSDARERNQQRHKTTILMYRDIYA